MKLLLLADQDIGKQVLDYLITHYAEDIGIVVCTGKNDIYQMAVSHALPALVFEDEGIVLSTVQEQYPEIDFDLGLLAWWPKLVKRPLLDLPKHGFINFHPSYLPYNRGKHYSFWAIVDQAPFGVTLHFADDGIDSGDIIAQQRIDYDWTDTGESLFTKAKQAMLKLFIESYSSIRTLEFNPQVQELAQGSFHSSHEIGEISRIDLDQHYQARYLLNLLRARTFPGRPACYFYDKGTKYEVRLCITKVSE